MVNFKRNSLITLSICNMIKLKHDIIIKHKKLIYKDIKYLSLIMKLISNVRLIWFFINILENIW